MARFDEKQLATMVAEEARLTKEIGEVGDRLKNEYESDAWLNDEKRDGKMAQYLADQKHHERLMRERTDTRGQREKYEDSKPQDRTTPEFRSKDVMRRWLQGSSTVLDKDEREDFILTPEAFPDLIQTGMFSSGGEVYIPDGVKSLNMAATDPTRSDIDAGDSAAGLAAPETWRPGLVERLKYFGAVASGCFNFSTDNGNDFHINQMDSTDEEGEAITGQTQATPGIPGAAKPLPVVGDIVFKSSWRSSKFIPIRLETLVDLQFDVPGRVQREAMRRMGRGWNKEFTTGGVTDRPVGIVPSAMVVDGGAGSADDGSGGIEYANLLALEYAIDLGYLGKDEGGDGGFRDEDGGMVGFMMNRNMEKSLRSAVDGDSRPIWSPNLEMGRAIQGAPGRIIGWPYKLNNHMATGTAVNDLPIMFGSMYHYGVRNIGGMMFYRFFDRQTIARMAIDFIALSRRDGRSLGPIVGSKCEAYAALQVKA